MEVPDQATIARRHYIKNREEILQKHREYYYANRETILRQQQVYRQEQRDRIRVYSREYARRRWQKAMAFLGDKCVGCGFEDERALQIDHVRGGGLKERRALGSSGAVYRRVLKYPEDYQLLCANCNRIKCVENGEITHA